MIFLIFFACLLSQSKTQMTKEERESLLKRTSKPILEEKVRELKLDRLTTEKDISFKYDPDKIKEILNKYNFPTNYSFFEDTNAEINVKNQAACGSCWSFASTSALSYRFFKKGINVDLSPQEPLSCLIKNCETGNTAISTQLNLVKNGTVTEECMPYTASYGIVEKCSSSCKDGSEKIKYYAKNAYIIEPIYDEEHYYDYVKVIIDQLINYGPVVSSISDYYDFSYGKFCSEVYSYDGISEYAGGHAIIIVGYGFYNKKYYWLIQNSYDYDWGENGFAKIGFGQVGVETVSFSEPYISNSTESKEISVNLVSFVEKTNCYINYTMDSYDEDLETSFELIFKNNKNDDKLYYYCGIVPLMDKLSHICLSNIYNISSFGAYELYQYSSLGKENKIKLINNKFKINLAEFFITISYSLNTKLYVSEIGSKILIMSYNCDECVFKCNIYPNSDSNPFEDCKQINFNNLESRYSYYYDNIYLVSCTIKENEIGYFNYSYNNYNDSLMRHDNICGIRYIMRATIYKLDKTKYPLLRIKDFILPNYNYLDIKNSEIILMADVEGSISGFTSNDNLFFVFIDIENNNNKKTYELYCRPNDIKIISNYTIKCKFNSDKNNKIKYDSVILYPYAHQYDSQPYEVIISKSIQKINENDEIEDEDENIQPFIKKSSGSSISGGAISGIVIGGGVVIALIIILIICLKK